jgi:hypothetical protein
VPEAGTNQRGSPNQLSRESGRGTSNSVAGSAGSTGC